MDPRVKRNIDSIVSLDIWLNDIAKNPEEFANDEYLQKSLQSQAGIGQLKSADRGVFGCSLNTLKRIAPVALDGGFTQVEESRLRALNAVQKYLAKRDAPPKKSTKESLNEQINELKEALQITQQDAWLLTVAFDKALQQGRYYANESKNPALIALCETEQKELRAMFSLRKTNLQRVL